MNTSAGTETTSTSPTVSPQQNEDALDAVWEDDRGALPIVLAVGAAVGIALIATGWLVYRAKWPSAGE